MPDDLMPDDLLDQLLALISEHPPDDVDPPGTTGWLHRLCRVASEDLAASGVAISLVSGETETVPLAASDARAARWEVLQVELGEGPCLEAYESRRPVLVPDLEAAAVGRWPGYSRAAMDEGLKSVFAFPLQVGAGRLGALDVYRDETRDLSRTDVIRALTFAELVVQALLRATDLSESEMLSLGPHSDGMRLYQAQGMVMVQLGLSSTDALARLRAYAFAEHKALREVVDDIIARRLTLEPG